ncbi:MAG: hypothetical protein Q8926_04525, partial [Bacteroidota bacterium]|nr:hypothetical protein [Bacteroidota bacterium]
MASHLQYRDFIIVGMLFRKQKDQQCGKISGLKDNWIYLQDGTLMAGRLQIFSNWSPSMVK